MSTTKIQKFLAKFSDQNLANLQCAAADGRLNFQDSCSCLLHYFNGTYIETKWDPEIGPLAREAESEFLGLGGALPDSYEARPDGSFRVVLGDTKPGDVARRAITLELIHAEWERRARRPVDIIQQYGVDFEFTTQDR